MPGDSLSETARQVSLGYILGTPVCAQIAERGGIRVEKIADIVEENLSEAYERSSIKAKVQAIEFRVCRFN
jgi:predicted homoserine dehydrogenase-like protein